MANDLSKTDTVLEGEILSPNQPESTPFSKLADSLGILWLDLHPLNRASIYGGQRPTESNDSDFYKLRAEQRHLKEARIKNLADKVNGVTAKRDKRRNARKARQTTRRNRK